MEFLIGFLVAFSIGLTGVGAGIVTTPLLIITFDLEPAVAIGTALVFSAVIKVYTGLLYLTKGLYDRKILLLLTLGGAPGSILGSYCTSFASVNRDVIMVILGLIVLLSSSMNLFFSARKIRLVKLEGKELKTILPALSFFIGVEVGFSSVGAGVLVELLLLSVTDLSVPTVIGTSLIFGSLVAVLGGVIHIGLGNVQLTVLSGLLLGGVVGSFLAAKVIRYLPQHILRHALFYILMFFGGTLIHRGMQR